MRIRWQPLKNYETFSLLNRKRKQQVVMEKVLDTLDTSTQGLQSLIHNLPKINFKFTSVC